MNTMPTAPINRTLCHVILFSAAFGSDNRAELYNIKRYIKEIRNLEHIRKNNPADKRSSKLPTENTRNKFFSAQHIPINPNTMTRTYIPDIK